MSDVSRFVEYAAAFEEVYRSDRWKDLEPFFAENAVYEIEGGPPFGGRHEGRGAILTFLERSVNAFDRRFDSRDVAILEGPEIRDGEVWVRWRGTYARAGLPDLVIEGTETARLANGRIERLSDQYTDEMMERMAAYFATHDSKLASR